MRDPGIRLHDDIEGNAEADEIEHFIDKIAVIR